MLQLQIVNRFLEELSSLPACHNHRLLFCVKVVEHDIIIIIQLLMAPVFVAASVWICHTQASL